MSMVASLAVFCARVSVIAFKIPLLSGFHSLSGFHIPCKILYEMYFKQQLSNAQTQAQTVGKNENAGNNRQLLTKIEDFCSFRVSGFGIFACGLSRRL